MNKRKGGKRQHTRAHNTSCHAINPRIHYEFMRIHYANSYTRQLEREPLVARRQHHTFLRVALLRFHQDLDDLKDNAELEEC